MSPRTWAEVAVASAGVLLAAVVLNLTSPGIQTAGAEFLQAYDLSVIKTASESQVPPGATFTYTIIVTNTGDPTDHITVTDVLPPGTTFQSLTQPPPPGDDFDCVTPAVGATGSIICTRDSMGSGETQTLQVTVKVDPTLGYAILTNTVTVKPTVCTPPCDSDSSNDTSSASTAVLPPIPVPALSGMGLAIEILLLLATAGWALARLRVAHRPDAD